MVWLAGGRLDFIVDILLYPLRFSFIGVYEALIVVSQGSADFDTTFVDYVVNPFGKFWCLIHRTVGVRLHALLFEMAALINFSVVRRPDTGVGFVYQFFLKRFDVV